MRPEVRAADLPTTARILEITVEALTRWVVHEAPPTTDVEAFVDEAVTMLLGLLCNSGGADS